MNQKKAIVFFSAGIGDAVLLIPLVKRLKKNGYQVTGFFNSAMPCREMMENTGLLDEAIEVKNKTQQALSTLKKLKGYDVAILNYFAVSRKDLLSASAMAKEVITNKENAGAKIKYVPPTPNIHDAIQNLRLIGEEHFSLADLEIPAMPKPGFDLPNQYIALQVSSGNPDIAYKNWPLAQWMDFLARIISAHPEKQFVLLGNENDVVLAQKLKNEFGSKIISLVAQTTITQAMQVLSHASMFMGPDGGLMHLAVAFGKPTFTIWGPSSDILYGYQQFDPVLHQCVRLNLDCFPCNAWIEPNQVKTKDPALCPDHACLMQLSAQEVFNRFAKYVNSLPQHVW